MYLYNINVLCVNIREFPNVMSHVTDHNLSVIAMIFISCIIASGCTTTQRQLQQSDTSQIAIQKWGWPVKIYLCGQRGQQNKHNN